VNVLRSLGNEIHIEEKNAKQLQKREEVVVNGRKEYHKKHGRVIQNRCGGYFQQKLKDTFERTNGKYVEVKNKDYKASQYNHILNEYIPKDLSVRMYNLDDDTPVHRDLYSSLVLYCMKNQSEINKELVKEMFPKWFRLQNEFISKIKREKIKIVNSGIS